MAHKLTKSDIEYIKAHFRTRSNRQMAEDLKVDKNTIVHAISDLGLKRTREQELRLKSQGMSAGPASKEEAPVSAPMIASPVPFSFHRTVLIIIFGLVFFLYADSFKNKFVWDDEILVVQNNYIKYTHHIPDYFTQNTFKGGDRDSNFWRPVQLFSYLVDFKVWGLNPFGFHLSNTLYHAMVCVMVYIYLFLLFRRKELALLATLIYAVHPIHTEAVTYIAGRADSQAAFFILLSLCLYLRYTQSEDSKSILVYFGSFLSFILALMSKEMSSLLPAYMLLSDLATFKSQSRHSWINVVLRYIPFLALMGIYGHLRATDLDFATIPLLTDQPADKIPVFMRFITFTRSLFGFMYNEATRNFDLGYLWLLLFPFNLHMERGTPYALKMTLPYFVSFIAFIGLILLAVFYFNRSKVRFFGLAFFIVGMIPFMDIVPLNANMAEHWLYIPAVGIIVFVSDLVISFLKIQQHHSIQDILKKITFSLVPVYLIYCGILTMIRNLDWKDEFTIWKETARLSNSSHIHGNLGVAYGRRQDFESAKKEFMQALRLQFNYPEAHNNLGVILLMQGKLEDAKREFEYAIQFNPNYSNAYKNLGDVYSKTGQMDKAKEMWHRAVEINPYHQQARDRLQGQ
jgi:tetratricopeptide (TPR) repeat protein